MVLPCPPTHSATASFTSLLIRSPQARTVARSVSEGGLPLARNVVRSESEGGLRAPVGSPSSRSPGPPAAKMGQRHVRHPTHGRPPKLRPQSANPNCRTRPKWGVGGHQHAHERRSRPRSANPKLARPQSASGKTVIFFSCSSFDSHECVQPTMNAPHSGLIGARLR